MESGLLKAFHLTSSSSAHDHKGGRTSSLQSGSIPAPGSLVLKGGPAKNELSWRECAGRLGTRKPGAEHTLPPKETGSTAVPASEPQLCPVSSSALLARSLLLLPCPTFSYSRPSVCFRHSEDYYKYPNRVPPEGTVLCFPICFCLLSSF